MVYYVQIIIEPLKIEIMEKKMMKELKQKAEKTARLDKKSKQFLFVAILLWVFFVACWMIVSFRPSVSYNGVFMGVAGLIFLCLLITCGIILPFGKISEEKVEKYFKDELSQRIKDDQEELVRVSEELVRVSERQIQLNEELKILKEL